MSMIRTLARVTLAAVVSLTLLFSAASPVEAGIFETQAEDPAVVGGNWAEAMLAWLHEILYAGSEPGQPMESLSAGAGGPTGPCIDPQGGEARVFCE
jgi:hypothetical protein